MEHYDARILNRLLDSYENSLLSQGKNKVHIHIAFPFTKRNIPEYFNESSLAYDEIHETVKELERKGFLKIIWREGKEGHIVQKVLLETERVKEVYSYLKRTPKTDYVTRQLRVLDSWERQEKDGTVSREFAAYLRKQIKEGKTVKTFIDIMDSGKTERIFKALSCIEKNREPCYMREFSIRYFADSKTFESLLGVVGKIIRFFRTEFAEMDTDQILAEYNIYRTPDYVYLKGQGELVFQKESAVKIDLAYLEQGIGISGADVEHIRIAGKNKVKKVITIENLTAFFRWKGKDSLMIYLGGYHNLVRRDLLRRLYRELPEAQYLHFGDIDVGGFEIYRDLCEKTGIPFRTYHMGTEELRQYGNYVKKLTENDRKRLERLMDKEWPEEKEIMEVLCYMKEKGVKLEQEIVRQGEEKTV